MQFGKLELTKNGITASEFYTILVIRNRPVSSLHLVLFDYVLENVEQAISDEAQEQTNEWTLEFKLAEYFPACQCNNCIYPLFLNLWFSQYFLHFLALPVAVNWSD